MAKPLIYKPIGLILQEADLVTPAQLEVALHEQAYFELPLGEILANHGWINQKTADFFVEYWPSIFKGSIQYPLGHYLQLASLLNEQQIHSILLEQQKLGTRFGATAVLKGWLRQTTIDYFLKNLAPVASHESAFQTKKERPTETGTSRKTHSTRIQTPKIQIQSPTLPPLYLGANCFSPPQATDKKTEHQDGQPNCDSTEFDLASVVHDDDEIAWVG